MSVIDDCVVLVQMGVEELQAQLAEKTTLLSEARLKEQQFVDRVSVTGGAKHNRTLLAWMFFVVLS